MKLAKVVTLNDRVQVIIKKIIEDEKHGFSMNFMTEEDDMLINITLSATFNVKKQRDESFDSLTRSSLIQVGKTLPSFKNLL